MERVLPEMAEPAEQIATRSVLARRAKARGYSTICAKANWRNKKSRTSTNMRGCS